jgi:hypothetical protein
MPIRRRPNDADDLGEKALLLLDNGVRPVPAESPLCLGAGQTLIRLDVERGEHLLDGQLPKIGPGIGHARGGRLSRLLHHGGPWCSPCTLLS